VSFILSNLVSLYQQLGDLPTENSNTLT
jgi:hypothetical protein